MSGLGFALALAGVALLALFVVCFLFVGLTYGVSWLARLGVRETAAEVGIASEEEKAVIAAAVMAYLDAEQGEK
ncbi:MAG: hypothetical protein SVP26_03830 [Chloroflexota bacterium]|nr:hypothetical protein [Chloroflexota bacterium]